MVTLTLVMRTIDRTPRRNYLAGSLASLMRSGVFAASGVRVVLVDGGSPNPHAYLADALDRSGVMATSLLHDAPLGGGRRTHNENATRAIQLGVTMRSDWVVMLEDDIEVCDRFAESLRDWLADHADGQPFLLYSFSAPYPHVRHLWRDGQTSWKYEIRSYYGNQCYAVDNRPRDGGESDAAHLSQWLAAHPLYRRRPTDKGVTRCHDLLLHQWAEARRPGETHFLASAPAFVQHVGQESALGNRYFMTAWGGARWRYRRRVVA